MAKADHALRFNVPNLQPQASEYLHWMERSHSRGLHFRHLAKDLRQPIKRNARVQMVDVMITDVPREPSHDRIGLHEARRFHGRLFIGPPGLVVERDAGKIVLGVEEIRSDGAGNQMRDGLRQQQPLPSQDQRQRHADGDVDQQRNKAVVIFFGILEEGIDAHSVQKHEEVTAENRQRVPHKKIFEARRR